MSYEREYFPKIEYWTSLLVEAVKNEDIYEIDHIHRKLDYFIQKQFDLNSENKRIEDETISTDYGLKEYLAEEQAYTKFIEELTKEK